MDVLAVVGEGLGMFVLLATIVAVAVDRRASAGFAGLLVGGALAALACVLVAQPERASVEAELPRGSAGDVVGRRVVPHGERSAGETTPTIEGRTRHVR